MFKVLALTAMFAALMCSTVTEAQSVPSCSDVLKEVTGKGLRVFVNLNDSLGEQSNTVNSLCVDFDTFR